MLQKRPASKEDAERLRDSGIRTSDMTPEQRQLLYTLTGETSWLGLIDMIGSMYKLFSGKIGAKWRRDN